jgi:hypothetical protein
VGVVEDGHTHTLFLGLVCMRREVNLSSGIRWKKEGKRH